MTLSEVRSFCEAGDQPTWQFLLRTFKLSRGDHCVLRVLSALWDSVSKGCQRTSL